MGKPTYDELTKAFWKAEDDRQELILENEELKNRINEAIQFIEIIQYNETYGVKEKDYLELLNILKGGNEYE